MPQKIARFKTKSGHVITVETPLGAHGDAVFEGLEKLLIDLKEIDARDEDATVSGMGVTEFQTGVLGSR